MDPFPFPSTPSCLFESPMTRRYQQRIRQRSSHRRRGIESVEAAITLPILFLILCPVLHLTHTWHVEKMLKIATYEAIKVAGKPDGTYEDAVVVFEEYTNAFGITNANLIVPEQFQIEQLDRDELFYLRAEASRATNTLPLPFFVGFNGKIDSGWVYYRKEG